jgi:hypothetical protein
LEQSVTELQALENAVVRVFAEHTAELFTIAGPNAVQFDTQVFIFIYFSSIATDTSV